MYASFGFCTKQCKTNKLNFLLFYTIIVEHFMKEMSKNNISKQCYNWCYFSCVLLSGCIQFFSKPVALDRCWLRIGWFCECTVGVITIRAQALAIVTITSIIVITSIILLTQSLPLLPPLWTFSSMLTSDPFPAAILIDCCITWICSRQSHPFI